MSDPLTYCLTISAVIIGCSVALWVFSLLLKDASIVDRFWGMGFVVVAGTSLLLIDNPAPHTVLVAAMTIFWGLRLSLYLTVRNWGSGEDYRYQAMRRRHGEKFPLKSLYTVFLLQGALVIIVSLPIQAVFSVSTADGWAWTSYLGMGVWCFGQSFEAIGDWQLNRFKKDPGNAGQVMDRGLWRYTRHPNYFGDAVVWWGIYIASLPNQWGIWVWISPLVMTIFLRKISGVPLLERRMARTRPGYAEYAARTPAFVPWFPKS